MSNWKPAMMDNIYYDKSAPILDWPCLVRMEANLLYVKYDDDGETQCWRGEALSPGHYELKLMEGSGHARLHQFPGGNSLVREWIEDGERGAWKVSLQSN